MTREEIEKQILEAKEDNYLLELGTSYGKSRFAILKAEQLNPSNVLIVVPRLILKANWGNEISKWGNLSNVEFSTYVGLKKYLDREFDVVILDEVHRLTENSARNLNGIKAKNTIMLSATIPNNLRRALKTAYKPFYIQADISDAIKDKVLPKPLIKEYPIEIDELKEEVLYTSSKKAEDAPIIKKGLVWDYIRQKKPYRVYLTPKEFLDRINNEISYWKSVYMRQYNEISKNMWLYKLGVRLKMLSEAKTATVIEKTKSLRRVAYFCSSIEQANKICPNAAIHSKNKEAMNILKDFNEGKINKIASCNMLNEGISLASCPNIVLVGLNSSEIMQVQKIGRAFRHKRPTIHIFYVKDTRDEELFNDIISKL